LKRNGNFTVRVKTYNRRIIRAVKTTKLRRVRFQVLKAAGMNTTVFGDVAQRSLVEVSLRFRGDEEGSKHL
jgi:hypothetical protein